MPSKTTELARRDRRMAQLYFIDGLETTDIAEILQSEGLLESKSEESARKTVRTRLADLKAERREDEAAVADTGTAKERHVSRMLYAVRKLVALIEDETTTTKVIGMTKEGLPVTTEVLTVPIGEKVKAVKNLAVISERLAVVTGVEVGTMEPKGKDAREDDAPTESFGFNFSGKSLDSLISARTGKGAVN